MGLGAMTSGAMDVSNSNMAAPLLALSLSKLLFAINLGNRVHDGARHGQRTDPRVGRRGRA